MQRHSNAIYLIILIILLITLGTVGYMVLLDVAFVDALYMTIITVSTVGFREIENLDAAGKLFTIVIIISGLGLVAYAFSQLAAFLAEGEFRRILLNRRVQRRLQNMKYLWGRTDKCQPIRAVQAKSRRICHHREGSFTI